MASARRRSEARRASPIGLPAGWLSAPQLRFAALVVLILLPIALVSPLRAALVEWARQGWVQLVGESTDSADAPPSSAATAPDDAGYTLFFTPGSAELQIVFDQRQTAGDLTVTRGDGPEGSFEVVDGDSEAVLTEYGVRVRNAGSARASYSVLVPPSVERVRVQIGGEPAAIVAGEALEAGWRMELHRPDR